MGEQRFLLSVLAIGAAALPAAAQHAAAPRTTAFDLGALPLDDALARYVRLTRIQVLYDSAITRGKTSSIVRGTYGYREALLQLLRGTGLTVRYTGSGAVFIAAPDAEESRSLVPIGRVVVRERMIAPLTAAERFAYYEQLKSDLAAAIRADSRTQRLVFALTVVVTVGAQGQIETASVRNGASKTDAKVIGVIKEAIVTPPPRGIAQPLAIRVNSQTR